MKKLLFLFLVSVFSPALLHGQNLSLISAKNFEGETKKHTELSKIVHDGKGSMYFSLGFGGSLDLDPGVGDSVLTNKDAAASTVVVKMGEDGKFKWARQFSGTNGGPLNGLYGSRNYLLDRNSNSYVAFGFNGTLDLGAGSGIDPIQHIGLLDYALAKLDSSGNILWVERIVRDTSLKFVEGFDVTPNGDAVILGEFLGKADFDPSPAEHVLTSLGWYYNMFVQKLDANGHFVWAKQFEVNVETGHCFVNCDSVGNTIITGAFSTAFDANPGGPPMILTPKDTTDIFLIKIDPDGHVLWARSMGGKSKVGKEYDLPTDLLILKDGSFLLAGRFVDTVDLDPGVGQYLAVSKGKTDAFVEKLDAGGNMLWARCFGDTFDDTGGELFYSASGDIYLSGSFEGKVDFDADPTSTFFLSSDDGPATFLEKMDGNGKFLWAASSESVGVNLGNIYSIDKQDVLYFFTSWSGDTTTDIDPSPYVHEVGPTPLVLVKWRQCTPFFGDTLTVNSCKEFILGNEIYTKSGTYRHSHSNPGACDSVTVINLTLETKTASYSLSVEACKSYTLNGATYKQSGIYNQTVQTSAGCDSIITLDLIIYPVDKRVTASPDTLTSEATGATYQWVECPTYAPIAEATSRYYTTHKAGRYAVIVSQNGCTDTSDCYELGAASVRDEPVQAFTIAPNPSHGTCIIALTEMPSASDRIEVFDVLGKEVYSVAPSERKVALDLSEQPAGIYWIRFTHNNMKQTLRFVIAR